MSDTETQETEALDAGAEQQAAELDALAAESVDTGEYMPGADQEPPPASAQAGTADVLAPLLSITFALVATRRGAHWRLHDDEATEVAKAYAEVLDKHFPDMAVGCELTAVMVTLAVVGPRVAEDKRQAAAVHDGDGNTAEPGSDGG